MTTGQVHASERPTVAAGMASCDRDAVFPSTTFPTPVDVCPALSNDEARLWVKNDGATHPVYGGNKVRKIEYLIAEAKRRGASRILTIGATGSHHVLTTAIFARANGLRAGALITPQPTTSHVIDTLRASAGQGAELYATRSNLVLPWNLFRAWQSGDYFVPPGGSNVVGAQGYFDAVTELVAQIRAGTLPVPDAIVVAVGSGGTCAGLLAGLTYHGLSTALVGVMITPYPLAKFMVTRLARSVLARRGGVPGILSSRQLALTKRYMGAGYGHSTPLGTQAIQLARDQIGLALDVTYTGKAFAAALELVQSRRFRNVLYWHTLSSAPLAALLESAPTREELPKNVQRLLGQSCG